MKPEEQQIAIAEACGWTAVGLRLATTNRVTPITGRHPIYKDILEIPDYLNDLNAMHEAEKVLEPDLFGKYCLTLQKITSYENWFEVENRFHLIHATASQRAEAFLKTLGLWKEEVSSTEKAQTT